MNVCFFPDIAGENTDGYLKFGKTYVNMNQIL